MRVKRYNSEADEIQYGKLVEQRWKTFVVIPDHNLNIQESWEHDECELIEEKL